LFLGCPNLWVALSHLDKDKGKKAPPLKAKKQHKSNKYVVEKCVLCVKVYIACVKKCPNPTNVKDLFVVGMANDA
jgi:hypothetical protein